LADKTDETIVDEVEKRLEDLFGDDDDDSDTQDAGKQAEEAPAPEQDIDDIDIKDVPVLEPDGSMGDVESSPLKGLKTTVLSIEWEITDDIMDKFLTQVDELIQTYTDDRIIYMFLQLLRAIGKYIKAKKANADPDVVRLLNTTYAALEETQLTKGISEAKKKKLLIDEVNKFKTIKERLTGKKFKHEGEPEVISEPKVGKEPPVLAELEPKIEEEAALQVQSVRKGMGFGRKFSIGVSAPIIVVAAVIYLYVCRLTGIPDQIDQTLQKVLGVQGESATGIVLGLLCCLLIFIGVGASRVGNGLEKRIKELSQAVERMNAGDKDVSIPINAGGEVGVLAEAISRLKDSLP
jgi:methyl-accepting chemotaxis protein